jgi:hypothetical protein
MRVPHPRHAVGPEEGRPQARGGGQAPDDLLVADTHNNRAAIKAGADGLAAEFLIGTREALRACIRVSIRVPTA